MKVLEFIIKPPESCLYLIEPFPFAVEPWQIVKKAKILLGNILRVPPPAFHLIFKDKELKDEYTFVDQSVCDNEIVRLEFDSHKPNMC